MPSIGVTKVWITIDDEDIPEYQISYEGDRKATCHVPSEVGKDFKIQIEDFNAAQSSSIFTIAYIYLDGVHSAGTVMRSDRNRSTVSSSPQNSQIRRPFKFTDLRVTDEGSCSNQPSSLGVIRVLIVYGSVTGERDRGGCVPLSTEPVHEREKKATSHRVGLGEPFYTYTPFVSTELATNTPRLEFIFNYAHRDILQAKGITHTSPPPQNAVIDVEEEYKASKRRRGSSPQSDAEFLDGEEAAEYRRLQERIASKKRKAKNVKREVKEELRLPSMAFKLAASGAIDLTDD